MYALTSPGPENNPNYVNFFTRMISNFKYKWPPGVCGMFIKCVYMPVLKLCACLMVDMAKITQSLLLWRRQIDYKCYPAINQSHILTNYIHTLGSLGHSDRLRIAVRLEIQNNKMARFEPLASFSSAETWSNPMYLTNDSALEMALKENAIII